ncbi:hypothetical protein A500_19434 [Clostridium sartagoforme AAU1]|uniref:Uncharacterized protein n=1 Tax=Clostridium sartagoforme AAU1 TaxID=1202534 RepID=R9BSC0_9CLOT|nr:hypothetical protein [Clostridium sartagoforme]EOR19963.1 hypothetical protein A500_19434 [Clostridium sartagoforme AAU1]
MAESGMPVFKDANKAFKQAKIDFAYGFDFIKDEFNLNKVNRFYWKPYKTYGWQVTTEDDELKKQCLDISVFFDIYENSFGIELNFFICYILLKSSSQGTVHSYGNNLALPN